MSESQGFSPRPKSGRNDDDDVRYRVVERTEHRSLIEVSSARGVFRYSVPNHPLNVVFTSEGIKPAMSTPWNAAGVGPPTPRRSITMPATSPTKAILAAILTALASFLATVQGRADLAGMKAIDWIIVLVSAAVAGLTVYLVPNTATGTRRRTEGGQGYIGFAIGAVVLVILIIVLLRLA